MTDPRPAQGAAHASHDLFVIAAAADRDADAATRAAAERQMGDCDECTALFADLQAISSGLVAMPRELSAPRDFRLTPEQAAGLRRGGIRRFLDGFRLGPSLRPMGTALATLGFAGLFLTVGLPTLLGGFGAASGAAPILSTVGAPVPAAGGAYAAQSSPARTTSDGKSGSNPPADTGTGGEQSAAGAASAAPASSADAAALNPQASATDTSGEARTVFGPLEASPPDLGAIAMWLSLGALVVGLGLLVAARFGARTRP